MTPRHHSAVPASAATSRRPTRFAIELVDDGLGILVAVACRRLCDQCVAVDSGICGLVLRERLPDTECMQQRRCRGCERHTRWPTMCLHPVGSEDPVLLRTAALANALPTRRWTQEVTHRHSANRQTRTPRSVRAHRHSPAQNARSEEIWRAPNGRSERPIQGFRASQR